jgi:glycosyltransferase involved in cell wall biosynthesis
MRSLAFYYHIPICKCNEKLYIPSYLGVFIDSLASNVDILYLVMHEVSESGEGDYFLKATNIEFVSLGIKTPAWHRMIFHKKILFSTLKKVSHVDYLIIRSPSPLAPFFCSYFDYEKIVFMVVGDYSEARKQINRNSIKSLLVSALLKWNNHLFLKEIKRTRILVNSGYLKIKYEPFALKILQIKTTTLSSSDFYRRIDTCKGESIRLLYTGRLDIAKGLVELVLALSELNKVNSKFTLDIVGWETQKYQPVRNKLIEIACKYGQQNQLTFHDKLPVGDELNRMYRVSDIYVIPSFNEGFPRTIWEAMANSCPVIATNVGSIPLYIENNKEAILIEPKNVQQIVEAVEKLVLDDNLRKRIIDKGFLLAQSNTLEIQTKILIDAVYSVYV